MKTNILGKILIIFVVTLIMPSCASVQQKGWLTAHRTALQTAAQNTNLNAEQKMDIVLTEYAAMMEEGLQFVDPRKGVRYINKFQSQNEGNLNQILGETTAWISNISVLEAISLASRLPQKPQIRQFIDVGKRFRRKYEAYKNVIGFTSKIGGAFGKFGGSLLGL